MTNSFIEKKVEETSEKLERLFNRAGVNMIAFVRNECSEKQMEDALNVLNKKGEEIIRSALRDHVAYLKEIVEREMEKEYPNDGTEKGEIVAQALTDTHRRTCSDILALLDKEIKI